MIDPDATYDEILSLFMEAYKEQPTFYERRHEDKLR